MGDFLESMRNITATITKHGGVVDLCSKGNPQQVECANTISADDGPVAKINAMATEGANIVLRCRGKSGMDAFNCIGVGSLTGKISPGVDSLISTISTCKSNGPK